MPQYFFSIRAGNEDTVAERAAELNDDSAALNYACEIVREPSTSPGSSCSVSTPAVGPA
jgi:hypothetical protein